MINNKNLNYFSFPYPHVIIRDSLSIFDELLKNYPDESKFTRYIRMDGDLSWPEYNYKELLSNEAFQSLHNYIYSEKFINEALSMFKEEILFLIKNKKLLYNPFEMDIKSEPFETKKILNPRDYNNDLFLYPRLDIGYGKLNYGKNNGGGGIHVDNFGRIISILIFFDDYKNMFGGDHRMYKLENKELKHVKNILPEKNMFVASLQTNFAFHDVKPISYIVGSRRVLYIAVSCSKKIWADDEKYVMKHTKSRYERNLFEKIKFLFFKN